MIDSKSVVNVPGASSDASRKSRQEEFLILTCQKRVLVEGLADEASTLKRQRESSNTPSTEFYERAYAATIIPRIMSASRNRKDITSIRVLSEKAFSNFTPRLEMSMEPNLNIATCVAGFRKRW